MHISKCNFVVLVNIIVETYKTGRTIMHSSRELKFDKGNVCRLIKKKNVIFYQNNWFNLI